MNNGIFAVSELQNQFQNGNWINTGPNAPLLEIVGANQETI